MIEHMSLTSELYEKLIVPDGGEIVVKRDYFLKNALANNAHIVELFCSETFYSLYKNALPSEQNCRIGVIEDEQLVSFLGGSSCKSGVG